MKGNMRRTKVAFFTFFPTFVRFSAFLYHFANIINRPMKKFLIFSASLCLFFACTNPQTKMKNYPAIDVQYPETAKVDQVDDYHGTEVADPYRWLEQDTAQNVVDWVARQNDVTFGYLNQIPFREAIEKRYTELFNYPKLSSPRKIGEHYIFYKNDGLQNQSVIYIQKGLEGEPEVFIDPNTLSEDGTISISLGGASIDNRFLAIFRAEAGSDWNQIRIMDLETKEELDDRVNWVKFSGASWYKDGFFYSRYPEPKEGAELLNQNLNHTLYYHKMGTDQSEDKIVYSDPAQPRMNHYAGVTDDEQYLVMYATPGTDGRATYIKNLSNDGEFQLLFEGYSNKSSIVHHLGDGKFLATTDIDAPKYRLIEIDATNPAKDQWKDIIPESEHLLEGVSTGGGKLFATYLQDATNRIYQFEYDGSGKSEIALPGLGSAGGFNGKEEDNILFYAYTSFIYPPTIFTFDVASGESTVFYKAELKFNPDEYVEKQVFFTSKDGTKVPMFLVHQKGLELDGNNPTELYAYGGFNISMSPGFSSSRMILLENGGVYAMANLRGGGEYGEEWHKAGMLENKQNVFDDFIAAAEYLIEKGYTSSEKLAISGGSNGGLLVGACMAQRPDLYAVAFPAVGVMDMLRYQLFTIGRAWAVEYGSSEVPEQFDYLYAYSPLHNLMDGTNYPATMVTTADHDDRVVPAHSFKFAARLQEAHSGSNPVLIRIDVRAGHGAGKPTSKIIEEQSDKWAFFFYNTNSPISYTY
jgi:prolyl oligopeptidase